MKIITVHGIRRKNRWYEILPHLPETQEFNLEFLCFDYNYLSFQRFIRKGQRTKILEEFCNFYSKNIKASDPPPSVIAHSFGTYIVYQAMKKYDVIKFDKIIFCGSILNQDIEFRNIIEKKQFNILLIDELACKESNFLFAEEGRDQFRVIF